MNRWAAGWLPVDKFHLNTLLFHFCVTSHIAQAGRDREVRCAGEMMTMTTTTVATIRDRPPTARKTECANCQQLIYGADEKWDHRYYV